MKRPAIISLFLVLAIQVVSAQPPASTTATTTRLALPPGPLRIEVTGIERNVQVRVPPAKEWTRPAVGMVLPEGTECRTSLGSALRLAIAPDQTLTLDRLGKCTLLRARIENNTLYSDVGMEYGRVRYDVEAGGARHESVIRSPSSTLAVRGTQVSLYDQPPFTPEAVSLTGRAQFADARKRVAFGGKSKTKIDTKSDSAAELAFDLSYVDPTIANARSPSEQQFINQVASRGGVFSFDRAAGIEVVRGGGPFSFNDVLTAPPGALNVVLTWSGNADWNLGVIPRVAGLDELIFPVFPLDRGGSVTRGATLFDHRGGPNGGIEVVFFPPGYPGENCMPSVNYDAIISFVNGTQKSTAQLQYIVSGTPLGDPAEYTVDANGKPLLSRDFVQTFFPCGVPQGSAVPAAAAGAATSMKDCGCDAAIPATVSKITPTPAKASSRKPAGPAISVTPSVVTTARKR